MSEPAVMIEPVAPASGTPAPASSGFMTGTPANPPPSAAPPGQFFGEHIAKEGRFTEGWTEQLRAAGFERLATKAAMAPDETTFFKTMDDTLGFVGKKSPAVAYPQAGSSDEEVSSFRKAAGVPDHAEAYALKPAVMPEGLTWNDEEFSDYAKILHAHHVPEAAAKELVARHLQSVAQMASQGKEVIGQRIAKFAEASAAIFSKDWGDGYDARLEANRAFVSSRFAAEEMADPVLQAALSHPQVVRVIDEARRALREAPLPGVGQEVSNGSHSPRQQAMEIMRANPSWSKDPGTAQRVHDLYALDAAQAKRGKR